MPDKKVSIPDEVPLDYDLSPEELAQHLKEKREESQKAFDELEDK